PPPHPAPPAPPPARFPPRAPAPAPSRAPTPAPQAPVVPIETLAPAPARPPPVAEAVPETADLIGWGMLYERMAGAGIGAASLQELLAPASAASAPPVPAASRSVSV